MNKPAKVLSAVVLLGAFFYLAFFLFNARELGYLDSAIGSLRELNNSAQAYAVAHPKTGFPRSIDEMYAAGLINDTLRLGLKNRYRYTYLPRIWSQNGLVEGYEIHGDPIDSWPKRWHFYTDETGVIREREDAPANKMSPPF
ncbi:MAG TPA: hypothetical protein VFN26_14310 [Candidatus Acidoferrum sp.]|nr:hypothetical protein [Candidatus Acidoferrum sp.]